MLKVVTVNTVKSSTNTVRDHDPDSLTSDSPTPSLLGALAQRALISSAATPVAVAPRRPGRAARRRFPPPAAPAAHCPRARAQRRTHVIARGARLSPTSRATNASTASTSASPTTTHPPNVSPPFSASATTRSAGSAAPTEAPQRLVGETVASATGTPPWRTPARAAARRSSPNSSSTPPRSCRALARAEPAHGDVPLLRRRSATASAAASRPCRHGVAFRSPPTPYAGSIRSERASSAAGPDATRAHPPRPRSPLTMSSASRQGRRRSQAGDSCGQPSWSRPSSRPRRTSARRACWARRTRRRWSSVARGNSA